LPIQAVLTLTTVIDFLTSKGSSALDISKAFDTVCHAELFKSLIKAGVPGWIIKLIRYSKLMVAVGWFDVVSEFTRVHSGVRQGTAVFFA